MVKKRCTRELHWDQEWVACSPTALQEAGCYLLGFPAQVSTAAVLGERGRRAGHCAQQEKNTQIRLLALSCAFLHDRLQVGMRMRACFALTLLVVSFLLLSQAHKCPAPSLLHASQAQIHHGMPASPTEMVPPCCVPCSKYLPQHGQAWCSEGQALGLVLLPTAAASCCFVCSGKEDGWEASKQKWHLAVN